MSKRSMRIKQLIVESGLSYVELEKVTGIKKSSLQRYASGATEKIPLNAVERLSDVFNVSRAYLMGWDEEPEDQAAFEASVLKDTELMDAIKDYMKLTEEQKKAIRQMIKAMAST